MKLLEEDWADIMWRREALGALGLSAAALSGS